MKRFYFLAKVWQSFEQLLLVLLQVNIYRCSSWQVFLVLLRLLILTDFQTYFLLVLLLTSIEFWTAIYVQFTTIRYWTSFELFLVLLLLNFDRVLNDFSIALLMSGSDRFLKQFLSVLLQLEFRRFLIDFPLALQLREFNSFQRVFV